MPLKKLPASYAKIVLPLIISIFMSGLVSAVSTMRIYDFDHPFLEIWLPSWGLSWIIAFPILLIVLPLARRLTAMLTE
jgi:hypothetical protein